MASRTPPSPDSLSVIPFPSFARSPLPTELSSSARSLAPRCSAPLIAGISHRPSVAAVALPPPCSCCKSRSRRPELLMVSLSLFPLSGGKSNLWRFSEKVGNGGRRDSHRGSNLSRYSITNFWTQSPLVFRYIASALVKYCRNKRFYPRVALSHCRPVCLTTHIKRK